MGVQIAKYFIALTLAAVERKGQALLPCHTDMRGAVESHAYILDRAIEPALLLSQFVRSRNWYWLRVLPRIEFICQYVGSET